MVKTSTLLAIAGYGGVFCVGSGIYFNFKIQSRLWDTDYYKLSMKLLRQHQGAKHLLGEPIKDGNMDLGDTDNNCVDGLNARLAVPVKGPKQKGKLFLFANRSHYSEPYAVDKLELQLQDDETRRLLVYDRKKIVDKS